MRLSDLTRSRNIRLTTDKFSERAPGLFKPEFVGRRGVWLTVKCYLVQNEALSENKYSCKGVSKQNNDLHFQRYKDFLDDFLKTRRDSELEEKILTRLRMWVLGSMIKALWHTSKTSLDCLSITISVMSWLMVFIQGVGVLTTFKKSLKAYTEK